VIGLDGKVHSGNTNIDLIGYTSPQLAPGLTVGINYVDRGTSPSSTGLAAGTSGAAGTASGQASSTANVTYGAGPISARFDVTTWSTNAVATNSLKNRFRVSGNYDLGMAKLGLGYSSRKNTNGTTTKNTTLGVSAPLGATTIGLVYEKNVSAGVTKDGVTFGAQYNLSKRTNISAGYAQWKNKTAGTATDSSFRVLVGHSF
jgi:predicted porin